MPRTRPRSRARGGVKPRSKPRSKPRDWNAVIDRLNRSTRGELRIRMGSPGSAQVTRVRLLEQWAGIDVTTVGPVLILRLAGG